MLRVIFQVSTSVLFFMKMANVFWRAGYYEAWFVELNQTGREKRNNFLYGEGLFPPCAEGNRSGATSSNLTLVYVTKEHLKTCLGFSWLSDLTKSLMFNSLFAGFPKFDEPLDPKLAENKKSGQGSLLGGRIVDFLISLLKSGTRHVERVSEILKQDSTSGLMID